MRWFGSEISPKPSDNSMSMQRQRHASPQWLTTGCLIVTQAPSLPIGRSGFKAHPVGEETKTSDSRKSDTALMPQTQARSYWSHTGSKALGSCDWCPKIGATPGPHPGFIIFGKAEKIFSRAKRGIWNTPVYSKFNFEDLLGGITSFQIVEDRTRVVATGRFWNYLNLVVDQRREFTPQSRVRATGTFT